MDRNTITGLVLIFLVMIGWAYFSMPSQEELQRQQAQQEQQARQDSLAALEADTEGVQPDTSAMLSNTVSAQHAQLKDKEQQEQSQPGFFSAVNPTDTAKVVIQTPLYRSTFTNLGAGPASFTLKEYETWDHQLIQMIEDTTGTGSVYNLGFLTDNGHNINTRNLLFEQLTPKDTLRLKEGETASLKYALNMGQGKRIVYTYTFNGKSYTIDLDISFEGLKNDIIPSTMDFGWESKLAFTEKKKARDAKKVSSYVFTGGEMVQLKLGEPGRKEKSFNGSVDWVATRTQFFTQIIKSESPTRGALLVGKYTGTTTQTAHRQYKSYLKTKVPESGTIEVGLYMGPLAYHTLVDVAESAYNMVDVGYDWTSWFSEPLVRWAILPYFDFMADFMNVGLAIIVFGILVKLLLYPLTKKSFKSMAAMKELQPEIKEIQEKYKDDPKKQQEATMKLYKKAKVNPIGGCLPNLLQFPILITLWRFFQNSILIRQEAFLWANDLSAPDYILNLPFEIPFLGDQLAGFVLLMTIAMIFQTQLTGGMGGAPAPGGGSGGSMKMLQYLMPVMLLFFFNNLAAGLSLYYLVYNIVSIGQQLLINKQLDQEKELEKAVA